VIVARDHLKTSPKSLILELGTSDLRTYALKVSTRGAYNPDAISYTESMRRALIVSGEE
jgi:hypothetical protein